jgi:inosose dehydratase
MSIEQRIAGAPISWGVCEVPGWGHQIAPERVFTEMRDVGLAATEAGPADFLPWADGEVSAFLAQRGLGLVGGFVPAVLHRDRDTALADVREAARRPSVRVATWWCWRRRRGAGGGDRRARL